MARIEVVGSVNLDLVVTAPRLPAPGETLTDGSFAKHPGGKGANQALAARRLGAEVGLTARVGEDPFAAEALALLEAEGVDLQRVERQSSTPTGVALIMVDVEGRNQILVAPGANRTLHADDLALRAADAVICQLEIPIEVVAEACRQADGLVCVNAAPAAPLPDLVLQRADVVVVNETEARALAGQLPAATGLVVETLGAEGAVARRHGAVVARARPPRVTPVDTVGAGDAFVAALVVALAEGRDLEGALSWACAAGAVATTHPGAQPSLPARRHLEEVLSR